MYVFGIKGYAGSMNSFLLSRIEGNKRSAAWRGSQVTRKKGDDS